MNDKQKLQQEIDKLEKQLKPLQDRLNKIYAAEQKEAEAKVAGALRGKDAFTLDELRFAAYNECDCGAGLCYPKNIGIHGSWYCSAILLGRGNKEVKHTAPLPFVFYEIKSEDQPSANGATTRPKE